MMVYHTTYPLSIKYSLGSTISIFTTIEAQTVVEPIVEPHRRASTILLQLLFTTIEAL